MINRKQKEIRFVRGLPLPAWAQPDIEPAFLGVPGAASELVVKSDGHWYAVVAALYRARIEPAELRPALEYLWTCKHGDVENRPISSLRELFEYANFDVSHLPEVVQIYRGTNGVGGVAQARRGFHWTLDLDVARWFAQRFDVGTPLVIGAKVPRSQVVMHCNDRDENEVVVLTAPSRVPGMRVPGISVA